MTVPDQVLGGRYRLVRQLGEGGMGHVWEARDETLGRPVAVKVISLLAGGGSRGDEARARFLREARITARLQHPGIVTIHDLGETGSGSERVPFLVMELVRGEGLDAKLRRGAVTLQDAARWGAEISDALAEAHSAGVMHRDIKPSNILVMPSGIVKVLDFGIARAADPSATADRLTQTGFIVGTPPYMAPEQARGHPEPHSDLYALGCLLFELITGRLPFQAPDTVGYLTAHLTQEPPAPSSVSAGIPSAWDDLVLTLLHKEPGGRCANAAGLSQALRELDRAPESAPTADGSTAILTTPGPTPLTEAGTRPGPRAPRPEPPGRQPGPAGTGTRPDTTPPPPRRSAARTATAVTAFLCLVLVQVIPFATTQAVDTGEMTSGERTAHVTIFGALAALLIIGMLFLTRHGAGRWLIAAAGAGLALQAANAMIIFDAIGTALQGVLPLAAATAALSAILAVLPATSLSPRHTGEARPRRSAGGRDG
ncbi:hypothetical protein AA958_17375 [Streptomyces sp. CNQ-509]|uniref:serine/threonine-protein kinase n=1 Tax=Streptomyces sp. CNQ-509 TaxID=444103 RepID=UPI00062DE490|nr:serine/threonine-protein kinase [Streptomyces sp. CNQ-509]AKH83687.1 hypothetical protein AA958_17375 [Streptomyces sp. CNQ-509]